MRPSGASKTPRPPPAMASPGRNGSDGDSGPRHACHARGPKGSAAPSRGSQVSSGSDHGLMLLAPNCKPVMQGMRHRHALSHSQHRRDMQGTRRRRHPFDGTNTRAIDWVFPSMVRPARHPEEFAMQPLSESAMPRTFMSSLSAWRSCGNAYFVRTRTGMPLANRGQLAALLA